jgi:hypothetical protein
MGLLYLYVFSAPGGEGFPERILVNIGNVIS